MSKLSDWLCKLEQRYVQEIKPGLERIRTVAARMDLLQPEAKIITVAGTNGKGSTVATLEQLYLGSGYKVATYTSPHLLRYNERIRINCQPIADEELLKAFTEIENVQGDIELSYFETGTLAALWYFQQHNPDIIILEVGMGGRWDATNIIDAHVAVITTIDWDHQEWLGDTLEKIAAEKAGILRSNQYFVGASLQRPKSIDERASALGTYCVRNGLEYSITKTDDTLYIDYQGKRIKLPKPHVHAESVAAAVIVSLLLHDQFPLSADIARNVLSKIKVPGRQQLFRIPACASVVVDVAHNPQSASYLANYIAKLSIKGKIHVVFSALKDKDLRGMVAPFLPIADCWYPVQLDARRANSREELISLLREFDSPIDDSQTIPVEAFRQACAKACADDLIVVYGSFILAGSILALLQETKRSHDEISI